MTLQHTILIVDDEKSLRMSLSLVLQKEGYRVDTAANAEEALAQLGLHEYDLMFLDLNMPGMSGIDLLVEIHKHYPNIPVLILTAFAALESAIQAVRLGAHDYLLKPAEPALILTRVAEVLAESEQPARKSCDRMARLARERSSPRFRISWLNYRRSKARIRLQPACWPPCHPTNPLVF